MSALPLTAYTDSKLQFFYLDQVDGHLTAVKGLPQNVGDKMLQMIGRIKPQQGRFYFEQILIDDKESFPLPSYNDFARRDYLELNLKSLLVDASSVHEYQIASKGLIGDGSSAGPLHSTIYWLLGELFAIDPTIIATYSFFDARTEIRDIPFDSFFISDNEQEKLLHGTRSIPDFHGINIFTHRRWYNHRPIKWESFDFMQTEEDAALLGAHRTGNYNLYEIRPSLEWLHQKFIESELKNIIDQRQLT
jgi:hypothetical protein